MKKRLVSIVASLLASIALIAVGTGSVLYVNQPETPEELLK